MANSPAEVLKDILVAAGVGVFAAPTGWGIYVSLLPDTPNTAITVNDTGGSEPSPKWLLDFPSCQVMLRGNAGGYQALYQKAEAVKNALLGYPSSDWAAAGFRLVSVRMMGGIASLGYDDNKRPVIVTNWTLITEPMSGTNRESL